MLEQRELLRFSTAGSVDDGKSTLIGRLLYDSQAVFSDQIAAIRERARRKGEAPNLALLTDGLRAEREQGITIDVAYRYFNGRRRKYIIADTPGHEQYTRNMATGASTADVAVVLVDASKGVRTQSRRHAFIAGLMRIPHIIVAVNKMDLVDYDQKVFDAIREEFMSFAAKLEIQDVRFVPISALLGDNVVNRSPNMPWYGGLSVLETLEALETSSDHNLIDLRFPVQYVLRPNQNFRGYAGWVAGGTIRRGEEILVLPSEKRSRVADIVTHDRSLFEAREGLSVAITLEDELDISRGDLIVHPNNRPHISRRAEGMAVWMDEEALQPGADYLLKTAGREVTVTVGKPYYQVDVDTLDRLDSETLAINEIGRITFQAHQPFCWDPYSKNRATGSFILIDLVSNRTVAAGTFIDRVPEREDRQEDALSEQVASAHHVRAERLGHGPGIIFGVKNLDPAFAKQLEEALLQRGRWAVSADEVTLPGVLHTGALALLPEAPNLPGLPDHFALELLAEEEGYQVRERRVRLGIYGQDPDAVASLIDDLLRKNAGFKPKKEQV